MRAAKALLGLHTCTGSSEPSVLEKAVCNKIVCVCLVETAYFIAFVLLFLDKAGLNMFC